MRYRRRETLGEYLRKQLKLAVVAVLYCAVAWVLYSWALQQMAQNVVRHLNSLSGPPKAAAPRK